MNWNALDHRQFEIRARDLVAQTLQLVDRPSIAHIDIVQRAHDPANAGNLADVPQRNWIGCTEPAKRWLHLCLPKGAAIVRQQMYDGGPRWLGRS